MLSSPESFLTPYLVSEIEKNATHKMMSPSRYMNMTGSAGLPTTLVIYDLTKSEDISNLSGISNIILVNSVADPQIVHIPYDNIPTTTFKTGWIIGTGMTGIPMKLLKAIDKGVYFHVKGCECRCPIIHAADVAANIITLGAKQLNGKEYILHDGHRPKIAELAEAFAYRLNGKRLYTISPKIAKFIAKLTGTSDLYSYTIYTKDELPDLSTECLTPRDVIHYLFHHTYTTDDI